MKFITSVLAIVLFSSCPIPPPNCPQCPPTPTPTPNPTPTPISMTGVTCIDANQPCDCIDFPPPGTPNCAVCIRNETGGITGVNHIGIVPACPPSSNPTPGPTPTPIPGVQCTFPQGVPDNQFIQVANPMNYSKVVDDTTRSLTICSGETDCEWGTADPQVYLAQLVDALQKKGYCAGQHRTGESDQISVAKSCAAGITWENYQPVNFGGTIHKARFAPGNVMDGWQVPVSCGTGSNPTPTPRPTPTPNSCPDLTNLKMKLEMLADPVVDVTPRGPDCARCASIGKSCDQGVCPLGPEGPTEADNAQRIACEDFYGPYEFTLNGVPCNTNDCFHHNTNQLQVKVKGHGIVEVTAMKNGLKNSIQVP